MNFKDATRTKLETKFKCSECGDTLTVTIDPKKPVSTSSFVTANSADEINYTIFINPCPQCKRKNDKVIDSLIVIKNAIEEKINDK